MIWQLSYRADKRVLPLADRHYNRQKIGSKQFVPPGRCLVLYAETVTGKAFWVSSWPLAEYTHHEWAGAWICTTFRNEGAGLASELIKDALKATVWKWGAPPEKGMITFINTEKVKPTMVHGRKTYGRTFELAGFKMVGKTKKNHLLCFQLLPEDFPKAEQPRGNFQISIFDEEKS